MLTKHIRAHVCVEERARNFIGGVVCCSRDVRMFVHRKKRVYYCAGSTETRAHKAKRERFLSVITRARDVTLVGKRRLPNNAHYRHDPPR